MAQTGARQGESKARSTRAPAKKPAERFVVHKWNLLAVSNTDGTPGSSPSVQHVAVFVGVQPAMTDTSTFGAGARLSTRIPTMIRSRRLARSGATCRIAS